MTEVELYITVKRDGVVIADPEKIRLLRIVRETGSLLMASKKLNISYNKAWRLMDTMNSVVNKPVVEKKRGGVGGGGVIVTDFGNFILKEYEAMEAVVNKFTEKLNTEVNL